MNSILIYEWFIHYISREEGCKLFFLVVKSLYIDINQLYAFITHGSGLPIAKATCFRVDGGPTTTFKVTKVGEFPDMTDSYMGYKDVDPKTCKGIK